MVCIIHNMYVRCSSPLDFLAGVLRFTVQYSSAPGTLCWFRLSDSRVRPKMSSSMHWLFSFVQCGWDLEGIVFRIYWYLKYPTVAVLIVLLLLLIVERGRCSRAAEFVAGMSGKLLKGSLFSRGPFTVQPSLRFLLVQLRDRWTRDGRFCWLASAYSIIVAVRG